MWTAILIGLLVSAITILSIIFLRELTVCDSYIKDPLKIKRENYMLLMERQFYKIAHDLSKGIGLKTSTKKLLKRSLLKGTKCHRSMVGCQYVKDMNGGKFQRDCHEQCLVDWGSYSGHCMADGSPYLDFINSRSSRERSIKLALDIARLARNAANGG